MGVSPCDAKRKTCAIDEVCQQIAGNILYLSKCKLIRCWHPNYIIEKERYYCEYSPFNYSSLAFCLHNAFSNIEVSQEERFLCAYLFF